LTVEARRAYFKEWRSKNKDKVKKHNANFWAKQAKKISEARTDNDAND